MSHARTHNKSYFALLFDPALDMAQINWNSEEILLGRSNTKKASSTPNFCSIGAFKNVSRLHARIYFDHATVQWLVHVLGSKGAYIDNKLIYHQETVPLASGRPTPIQMGHARFYFCPAIGKNDTSSA
eukprot:240164_1